MIVKLKDVCLTYQSLDGETDALKNLSLEVEDGQFVSIVGPSGCGKSTLLSVIAGIIRPSEGQVLVDGEPVSGPSPKIGYMPQKDQLFEWRDIWSNLVLGLELMGPQGKKHYPRVEKLLQSYGLEEFRSKTPSQLSGGMRQRCALIRTLATDPRILLLDEPFSALDYQTRLTVSADIHSIIKQEHKTALLVTHDISESISLSDRVVVLTSRPATVRAVHELTVLRGLGPMERRDHPEFRRRFNTIWKELETDG